ncbi:hypothetical protein [Rhizobium sp. Leaf386]|uniref:hypothetical protein n=1 Tax=Rhizobium sp. Leaf386 TaxID=1736359 RepID=UPI000715AD05|nr:hypothetical protein [Rhizobium sp. Leaf386]KQS95375.1 hypothetical protein ASG50_25455 [Rhizobium sp. Leaf386]
MADVAFEHLEIRHCIYMEDDVRSFTDETEFDRVFSDLTEYFSDLSTGWTLYGRYSDHAGQFLAMAIGDFDERDDAFTVMNALLAPMAKARDLAREPEFPIKPGVQISPAEMAACALDDFINQSSNHERL